MSSLSNQSYFSKTMNGLVNNGLVNTLVNTITSFWLYATVNDDFSAGGNIACNNLVTTNVTTSNITTQNLTLYQPPRLNYAYNSNLTSNQSGYNFTHALNSINVTLSLVPANLTYFGNYSPNLSGIYIVNMSLITSIVGDSTFTLMQNDINCQTIRYTSNIYSIIFVLFLSYTDIIKISGYSNTSNMVTIVNYRFIRIG